MLRKKERLTREDFNRFFAIGKRYNTAHFQLVYQSAASFHASVVVPKKVARSAVLRNKIRRRVYDLVRNLRKEMELSGVFIIIVRSPVQEMSFFTLKEALRDLIGRTKKTR